LTDIFSKSLAFFFKSTELLIFPSFCKICEKLLKSSGESVVCRACIQELRPSRASFCVSCGRFFEEPGEPHLCSACLATRPPYSCHRSCGPYRGTLKDILLLFKYRGYGVLGKDLARYVLLCLGKEESLWWDVDDIVPVPLHPKRKRVRGFNQAWLIARELAAEKNLSLTDKCLVKIKSNSPQTSLEARERAANVKGVFSVKKKDQIKGKTVLLVDDVFTTGSTIFECSHELRRAGAKEVRALTVAQA